MRQRNKIKGIFRFVSQIVLWTAVFFISPSLWAGGFVVNGGTVTLSNNTVLSTIDELTLTSGSLVANTSEIIVGSTWTKTGGTFTQGTSTVTFTGDGAGAASGLIGSTTFYALRAITLGTTLRFTSGTTTYVTNQLILSDVNLRSTTNNATWYLRLSGSNQNVANVDVKDSNASGGNTINATNSTNAGNNTNWNFIVADVGRRYWIATSAANWNSSANWSLASGGAGGAQVPLSTHTVIFDGDNSANGNCNVNTTVTVATLTISGYTGSINTQGTPFAVTNTFTQDTGTISLGTSAITLQGDLIRSGGNFSAGTSTINFTGSQNQSLTQNNTGFYHIVINKTGGTLTLQDSFDADGNFSLTQGTLNTNSQSLTIGGNWNRSGGTFTGTGSTVTLNAPTSVTLTGSTTFYGLKSITTGQTLRFTAGTTTYATNMVEFQNVNLRSTTDNSTWYFTFSGSSQTLLNLDVQDSNARGGSTMVADSQSVNSGNNLNWAFGNSNRYWISSITGNWNNTANWSAASGGTGGASVPSTTHNVIFDGVNSANGNANIDTTVTVATMTISGYTGTLNTQGFAVTVSSSFSQSTGLVSIGTSVVTMQGDMIRSGGSFSTGISTIQFTGGQNQTLTPGSTAFHHVVINKTGNSVTLGGNLNLIGQLTVTAGTFDTSSTGHYASSSTLIDIQASGIFNANNSTITLVGTSGTLFTKAGTFNQGNSKVIMTPNAAATLTSNNTMTFHHLELSPTMTLARAYTFGTIPVNINGNFMINPNAGSALALTVNLGSTTVVLGTTTVQRTGSATANLTTTASNRTLQTGNLNLMTGGTLTGNASTIILNGTSGTLLAMNGGTYTTGTSTIDIESDASVVITSGAVTFNNLTMTPTLTTNRVYTFGSGAIVVNGSLTTTPVKSDAGNATLEIDLGNSLTVAAAGTLTLGGTTNAYSLLDTTTSNYAISTGKINIQSNGTLRGNGSTITLTATTSTLFTETGSFIPGTSTVIMNPDAAVTLTSGNIEFYNLTFSPTITLARAYTLGTTSITVGGNFTINPNAGSALALTVNLGSTTVVLGTTTVQRTGSATANLTTTASNHMLQTGNLNLVTGGTLTGNASTIVLNGTSGTLLAMNGGTYTTGTSTIDIESDASVVITSGAVTFNNLTMTPTLTADRVYTFGSGAIVVNGSLTTTPVKSTAGNATLEIDMGNSITVAAAGTLTLGGTTNGYSLLDTTGSNFALSSGKINIQANGTLRGNGSTITLTATTSTLFTETGSFIPGTSTVIINPDAAVTLTSGNIDFNNLTLSPTITVARAYTFGTSSVTIGGAFLINPNAASALALTVNLGSTTVVVATTTVQRTGSATSNLTTTASNWPFMTGNLNVATGGTFTANASSITLTGATSPLITRVGTFTQGTSTVTIASTGSNTINSGTITFNHLVIDTPNLTQTFGTAVTVSGKLSILEGNLADGGFQITGNATNRLEMATDTNLNLGIAGTATTFPTLFTTANIGMNINSTVTYNAGVAQTISGTPIYGNLSLVAPSGTPTKTPGAAITVQRNVSIGASNTYSAGATSLTIGGSYSNSGTFTSGTGSVTFNSSFSGNTLSGNLTGTSQFNNLGFNGVGGDWTPTASMTVASTMTVTAGTLLGNNDITVNGGVNGNGTTGTITLTGGTFTQRVAANQFFGTNVAGSNNWTFNNLTFSNSSAANRIITTNATGSGQIIVNGTLTIGNVADTNTTTLANNTNNRFIDANSDLTITTRGVLQNSSSQGLLVGGSWTNNGTFTANNSTTTFDGTGIQTLTGSTTFYGLRDTTSGGTLRFTAATTFYATNMVEFQNITLQSTSNGATWYFKYSGSSQTLSNLNVRDSNAAQGSAMLALNSTNNGNNTNWDFGAPSAINDLAASQSSNGSAIQLTWTSPGDDASFGTLLNSTFTIQYTTDTVFGQSSSWSPTAAQPSYVSRIHIATTNVTPGSLQSRQITGLTSGSTYYFRAWTKDDVGNYSPISNGATNWATVLVLGIQLSTDTLTLPSLINLNTTLVISTSIVITNTGNVAETYEFRATTATPGSPWTIQSAQATDQFVLWALINNTEPLTTDFGNEDKLGEINSRCTSTVITNGGSNCVSVPVGETRTIWFKLGMPTLTTTGTSQQIRITGVATQPD